MGAISIRLELDVVHLHLFVVNIFSLCLLRYFNFTVIFQCICLDVKSIGGEHYLSENIV